MKRLLAIGVLCMSIAACGGSDGDSNADANNLPNTNNNSNPGGSSNSASVDLNPTALSLDSPPIDGKMPADLLPPA